MARRAGGGVEVALLWNESLNRVKVTVSDRRQCHYVELEVEQEDELHAFHRPFADASSRLLANDLQAALSERLSTGSDQEGLNA
jgi:hypothetical protein